MPFPQERPLAPEFPDGFAWWNTDRPLRLTRDLAGCVVIVDFWTYCCINCIHNIANLEKVAEHFRGQPVVIVGVHSNKFDNEADPANVRQAILRYGIRHPVIVDEQMQLWTRYGVRAWPTVVVVDPSGRIAGVRSGEMPPDLLIDFVERLLAESRADGTLAPAPPLLRPERHVPSAGGLAFPGKVAAAGDRLAIADSGHHRVLVATPDGRVEHIIGSGERGQADGPFDRATFHNPQGLAYDAAAGQLYIADTGNHLIRRADLAAGTVETILGTGAQVYDRVGGQRGRAQGLNSPWDVLLLEGGRLLIAMAGTHQLWTMDLATGEARAWIGSGREALLDGAAAQAALAQPSGLTWGADGAVYFADSEASAIRRLRPATGEVDTLVGTGLFDFGFEDGPLARAQLQHPLGVAFGGGALWITDTYNHAIRRIDLAAGTIATVAGNGRPGAGDPAGQAAFHEPGGVAFLGGRLYVADTNNHRIVELDPGSGRWREVALRFPTSAIPPAAAAPRTQTSLVLRTGARRLEVRLAPALDAGLHFNPLAPVSVRVAELDPPGGALLERGALQCTLVAERLPIDLTLELGAASAGTGGRLLVEMTFASCTDRDRGLCLPETRRWSVLWRVEATGTDRLALTGGRE